MNPWKLLEAKLNEAPPEPKPAGDAKSAQPAPAKKKPALNLRPHEDRPELEDVISQYIPEIQKASKNPDAIRNVLLHFSDEVEAVAGGN